MKLRLGQGVRFKQGLQTLGRSPRWRRKVIRQLDYWLTHFTLFLVGLANPLPQRADSHMQITGYVQHAARAAIPDFNQGLFLEFN